MMCMILIISPTAENNLKKKILHHHHCGCMGYPSVTVNMCNIYSNALMFVVCSRAVNGDDYLDPASLFITFAPSATLVGDMQCLTWSIISDNSLELGHFFTVNVDSAETPIGEAGIEVRLEFI